MLEVMMAILGFVAGLVVKPLIMSLRNTEFYERYCSRRVADMGKRILGRRIQIRPIGLTEAGFEHRRFHVVQVAIINRRRVRSCAFLDQRFTAWMEEMFNLFFCYPIENARVYTQFFNSEQKPLPEPKRFGIPFSQPPGVWVTLDYNEQARVDVAGISTWGDCYGANSAIRRRWGLDGTGNPNCDTSLGIGEFYLRVAVVDDKRGVTYATSDFRLKYGGSIETLEFSETETCSNHRPPSAQ